MEPALSELFGHTKLKY